MQSPQVIVRSPALRVVDRAIAALLLVLMLAGSLAMWIVVPAAALTWLVPLFDSQALQLFAGLISVPMAMILFALFLFWLNGLYLRVTGHWTYDAAEDRPRRLRGPLEPLLVWSLLLALALMGYWFFFLAGPGHLGP